MGIGKVAQQKHAFQGMTVSGEAVPVADDRLEPVEFYKVSKLKVLSGVPGDLGTPPPWHGVPADLETYRARGHSRLESNFASGIDSEGRSCGTPLNVVS